MASRKKTADIAESKPTAAVTEPFAEKAETSPVVGKKQLPEAKPTRKSATRLPKQTSAVTTTATVERTQSTDPFAEIAGELEPQPAAKVTKTSATKAVSKARPVKKEKVKKAIDAVAIEGKSKAKTTSPVRKKSAKKIKPVVVAAEKPQIEESIVAAEPKVELSPVFKALAEPKLPQLKRENRARLQMQTPTRLFLYWSLKANPWQTLRSVFGDDTGGYTLVVKLIDLSNDREQVHPIDVDGNWWFDVEPNGKYQAEIGFYAVNRPYFRIIYSNTVETPRRSPSPRPAEEAQWVVTADRFAKVLDVAGFSRDAFDVAVAGDDHATSDAVTQTAFKKLTGADAGETKGIPSEDLRFAMMALAAGMTMEELRFKVSARVFAILQAGQIVKPDEARSVLEESFGFDETEYLDEEAGPFVYGLSRVNFPTKRTVRGRSPKFGPRYNPVSSHNR